MKAKVFIIKIPQRLAILRSREKYYTVQRQICCTHYIADSSVSFIFLQQIKRELLDSQQKVSSLQELSAQLLVNTKPQTLLLQSQASEQIQAQGSACLEAQEKVHVILNRLRLLLREVSSDLEGLERRLETTDTPQVRKC